MVTIRSYTDEQLLALPPIVVEEGTVDSNGTARNRHERNPFLPDGKPVEDARRMALAGRWSDLHWNRESPVAETAADPFDLLRATLADLDGSQLFFSPPESDAVAGHPLQASDVAEWERQAVLQGEAAMALEARTRPQDKPQAEGLRRTARGD